MATMKLNVKTDEIEFGTNILKVKVPKQLRNKVKCGLKYVDDALGGEGFTPSQVLFFTGTPGAGKTTLMLTMADAMTKQGAIVLFNTAEESLFQTAMTAKRLKLKNGFRCGNSASVSEILENAQKMSDEAKAAGKPFVLIVDSL